MHRDLKRERQKESEGRERHRRLSEGLRRASEWGDRDQEKDPSSSSLFSLRLELVSRSRGSLSLALCTSPLLLGLREAQLSLWGLPVWGFPYEG